MKIEGEVGMETLQFPDSMKEMMEYIEGRTIQEKLAGLIVSHLENRFRSCTERLYEFEKNIGCLLNSSKSSGIQIRLSENILMR